MRQKNKAPYVESFTSTMIQKAGAQIPDAKDNKSSRIIAKIKEIFLSGQKVTALQINFLASTIDALKVISELRAEGWNIQDLKLPDNRKLYWLVRDESESTELTEFKGVSKTVTPEGVRDPKIISDVIEETAGNKEGLLYNLNINTGNSKNKGDRDERTTIL